ncbi:MAG TPA: flippase-like domain-containing protein [Bacillota bacterium]|nr:flippase-like domain-containing protein [Bacillota bacterium]
MRRHWLLSLFILAFVFFVIIYLGDILKLVPTLIHGEWEWLILAALLQLIYYLFYSVLYQISFYIVEVKSNVIELLPVIFGSLFVNTIAPLGGVGGAALFVDDAAQRGQSPVRAAAGTLLVFIAYYTAFTIILLLGLIFLFWRHALNITEIIGMVFILTTVCGLTVFLYLGLWKADHILKVFTWFQHILEHLGRWLPFFKVQQDWAETVSEEFVEASLAIVMYPERCLAAFLIAVIVHLVNLASLSALFLAFHQPVALPTIIAGYAVGSLFWIISIPPQGIGLVESSMVLAFSSMGINLSTSTLIAVTFRSLTFWLPMFLGLGLLRHVKTFGMVERSRAEALNVKVVALLTGLMGMVNIISAIRPALPERLAILAQFSPLEVRHGSYLAATLAGFALIILASRLWRRKRTAWGVTLFVLIISIISHLLKGLDYEEATLAAALALWLVFLHPHFHARSDRPSLRQGIRFFCYAVLFTLVYGVAGFYFLDRHFSVNFGLWAALKQTVIMFTEFYDPGLQPITGFGRYFADSIYFVSAVTIAYSLYMIARPVFLRETATPEERSQARPIIEQYGNRSITRFALMEDKSYYFSPGGSTIAFVPKGRIALALGDPIGPAGDFQQAIKSYQEFCSRHDWLPAFYQTAPENLSSYKSLGFSGVTIGHEGIVDLTKFSLEGNANKPMRTSVNRLTKLGHRAEMLEPPLAGDLLQELRLISDEWLAMMHGKEKRFSLGWFDDDYIRHSPVMVIYNSEGTIIAFANLITGYHQKEVTVDLMRRRREVENGTMDFLFCIALSLGKGAWL